MFTSAKRPKVLAAAVAAVGIVTAVVSADAVAGLSPTPRLAVERPSASVSGDTDSDLAQVAGRPNRAIGTPLLLRGRVLDAAGREVADARVEIWHTDAQGRLPDDSPDGDFQGYGVAETGGEGRFAFRTVRPGAYGKRAPHMNVRISAPGFGSMTTQVFFEGEPGNADDPVLTAIHDPAVRSQLIVPLTAAAGPDAEPGTQVAEVSFVLAFNRSAPA